MPLLQFSLQPLGRECLPVASELGIGRSNCRQAKFPTDEINATREHEHEHEDKHDRSFPRRCGGNDECSFHPASDSDDQQKAAGPNGAFETALRAEHVKEKQQRGQEQKSHELLYVHHPWARLGQEAQPGRMRRRAAKYGVLMPAAIATNIDKMTSGGCVKAKPSAVPKKGAVHGVARIVVKSPWTNEPASPSSPLQPSNPRVKALRQRDFENTEQIERKDKDYDAQGENEIRVCELETAPGNVTTGSF